MCIRDRGYPAGDATVAGLAPSADLLAQLVDQLFAVVRLETVSYTHLRAHETVLDLVCRLLLEKKKNIQ